MNFEEPQRTAYVHVPFCRHRCGYCNFTLIAGRDDLIQKYLDAVGQEMALLEKPRPVRSLYIGGGTPTHLAPDQLARLLDSVAHWFRLADGGEYTAEANPSDVCSEKIGILADAGVNRLSLGAQSFNDAKLAILERDHSATQIEKAAAAARDRIQNISIDLIFGVPGESLTTWKNDLEAAVKLGPRHLSAYGLTIEKGTQFWNRRHKNQLVPADEDLELAMYEQAIDRLGQAGYEHYEVSNFAQPGFHSRHNEAYWTGGEYYAVGPGASSHLDGKRMTNHRSTACYLKRMSRGESPVAECEELDRESRLRERIIFGLRMLRGIDTEVFFQENGVAIEEVLKGKLETVLQLNLLERTESHLRLTRKGLVLSDAIWPQFV